MVSVIHLRQFRITLLFSHGIGLGYGLDALFEILVQIFPGNSAYIGILRQQRDVSQVVQSAEHAQFPYLRHPCQKAEPDTPVLSIQNAVETLKHTAVIFLNGRPVQIIYNRLVIFVYQNDDLAPGLGISSVYDILKSKPRNIRHSRNTVLMLPS